MPRIGLALGSGSARGWAHIGVIRALEEAGIVPEIVCGSSIGAVVGGVYAAGELDAFEAWVRDLDWRSVVGYMDLSLRGGFIKARRVFEAMAEHFPDRSIESLPRRFAATATDLENGREIWLREGSVMDAMRASTSLPGIITPTMRDGRWLVDGGLVNPIPVSLCRALGADRVIAVDLNSTLLGRRGPQARADAEQPVPGSIRARLQSLAQDLLARTDLREDDEPPPPETPSLYEVMANSVNIMQVRIQRSRLAGDPPDLVVTPRLGDFGLLDFDRAIEAIETGRAAVAHALSPGVDPRDLSHRPAAALAPDAASGADG